MPKPKNPTKLTRVETISRLQEVKSYLGDKERLAFRDGGLIVRLPETYNPDDDESYYRAPKLSPVSMELLKTRLEGISIGSWVGDIRFKKTNVHEFINSYICGGAYIGSTVDIAFYRWRRFSQGLDQFDTTKLAVVWLGTWHHCPIVFWRSIGESKVRIDYLPKYLDLVK